MADNLTIFGTTYNNVTGIKATDTNGVVQTFTKGGGGGGGVEEKDVNFIDYDGTIVASYTAADFANLSALPANPSHTGLTAQGWNWSLSNAKAYVASYGKLWIGQMYTTDDGKTRIYIHIPDGASSDHRKIYVRFTQTKANGVTVDWGDGTSTETYTTTSATNYEHIYANTGDYVITLNVTSGSMSLVGSSSYGIFGINTRYFNRSRVYKIEIGNNVTELGNYIFRYCYALESVTIPSTVTSMGTHVFNSCYLLKSVTVPHEITTIDANVFQNSYGIETVAMPSTLTSIGANAFQYCEDIKTVTIPSNVTSIGNNAFEYCYKLKYITIPHELTSIAQSMLDACYSLKTLLLPTTLTNIGASAMLNCQTLPSVTVPASVTNIGSSAFSTMYGLNEIHFLSETPPTLGTTAFSNISTGTVIYVPVGKLTEYQTASNWSTYADYMQEEPQS